MRIAIAGTGYVGLSLAVLLAQRNEVAAVDVVPEKVDAINRWASPIRDAEIERFLTEAKAGVRELALAATLDGYAAYARTPMGLPASRSSLCTPQRRRP